MNSPYLYWWFKKIFKKEFCEAVIKHALQKQEKMALTGDLKNPDKLTKKQLKDLKKIRNSDVIFLNDRWIINEIVPFIHDANINAGWNFDIDYAEDMQFTIYKKGQFYGWHKDCDGKPYTDHKNENINGKIRKLSCSIVLSDSKNYKGGELLFEEPKKSFNKKPKIIACEEIKEQGSMAVFPSYTWHKVKPVTHRTRYSLVIWFLGKPYK